jgi:hypothetical protein
MKIYTHLNVSESIPKKNSNKYLNNRGLALGGLIKLKKSMLQQRKEKLAQEKKNKKIDEMGWSYVTKKKKITKKKITKKKSDYIRSSLKEHREVFAPYRQTLARN